MNNEYQSGLYGTHIKYFANLDDYNDYVDNASTAKEIPNVALIEGFNEKEDPDTVVLSPTLNAPVWNILDAAGLIDDGVTSLTIADCAQFTNEDLYNKDFNYTLVDETSFCIQGTTLLNTGYSIFTYFNMYDDSIQEPSDDDSDPWQFNEFKYFTGITEIGPGFFKYCRGLTEISIPSSVTSIGSAAFGECLKLKKCTIYNSKDNVDIYITDDQYYIDKAINEGVDPIFAAESAFSYAGYGTTKILYIEEKPDYTVVYNWTYNIGESVITATSNPDVYNILTAANFPHNGPNNGYTEADLAAITRITVNHYDNVSLQNNNMSIFSFYGNEDDNYISSTYDDIRSVFYNEDGQNTPNYVQSWTFNEFKYFTGLTELPENCFRNCTTLTEITLPDTITYIGNEAFHDCWNIEKFDTQGRIDDISWNDNAINYMSKHIVGYSYWDDYYGDTVDEHLEYLGSHGVDVS